ncbi:MAG: DUF169 domain-containing protein [Candidatus Methanomethylophilaceae archaeon]|nr:DUF169 domain-containing protein [Candidatus Methanomethylophilaceae archaeon]MDD3378607.1 DUF169 domain-containing protein [Candidatus Methanomethylophilaceae archaeon]MDY0224799.1 DUF169 domain-containing protein [Candidatus Methanomethylophilaceae archaeon]
MSNILKTNSEYAEKLKTILGLRAEPVAIKLIKEGEEYPACCKLPEAQMSHCQAMFRARHGECIKMPLEMQNCHVGASALGMLPTPEKVATGEFHVGIGIHDSAAAAAKMISDRIPMSYEIVGEVVCPLKDADFTPDVVTIVDIPERVYWIIPLMTAEQGGRATFSSSPFQCACEDITVIPVVSGVPNISLGCFGCRKKTDMAKDELAVGIPYSKIPGYITHLDKYRTGVLTKAKRE